MSEPITVDIWSDVQCPWCYIGKRRFEAAVADFDGDVEVVYHSFELSPDTPRDFEGSPDYLAQKRGLAPEQVQQMFAQVSEIAAGVGLDFDFTRMRQVNTVKAHELLHLAKAHGRQAEMKEALLKAYFIDGGNVGRVAELADLAVGVGLDRDEVVQALESDRYTADVQADVAQAAAYGITGVPFFVLDNRYGVSGAQETATFAEVLAKVAAERETSA